MAFEISHLFGEPVEPVLDLETLSELSAMAARVVFETFAPLAAFDFEGALVRRYVRVLPADELERWN